MHPIFAHRGALALYLLAWIPVAALLAALLHFSGELAWASALVLSLPMSVVYAFLCLSAWYLCRAFPLPATGLLRLLGLHGFAAFLSGSLWLLFGRAWSGAAGRALGWSDLAAQFAAQTPLLLAVGMLLFFIAAAVHYLMLAFERSREAERTAYELKILAREAELRALRAQIDPHFLFNSLNSISALTSIDPAKARRMCVLLSDFLRQSLDLGARELVSLEEEISLVSHFLEIERVRLGPRLEVRQELDEESLGHRVPPLLLQPIVENAIRHGIAGLVEGGAILVASEVRGESLRIRIENPYDPESAVRAGKGIGIANVRSRLAGLYGSDGRLLIRKSEGRFRVELSLPRILESAPRQADRRTGAGTAGGKPAADPRVETRDGIRPPARRNEA